MQSDRHLCHEQAPARASDSAGRPLADAADRHRVELGPNNVFAMHRPIKCVWSGRPDDEQGCQARIPMAVVAQAWQREMQRSGLTEGFFHFTWRGGAWLSYGCQDGGVRGVYCPTHCAEREARLRRPA